MFWAGVILAVAFPFLIPLIAIVWLGIYIYKKSIDNLPPDPADARWKYRMRYANTNFYDEIYDETDPYDPTEVIDRFDYHKPFYVSCDDE